MASTIFNASNRSISTATGTVPQMNQTLMGWFQVMTFDVVTKVTTGFQVVETTTPVTFRGVIQPLTGRQLEMLPIGQRKWNGIMVHSDTALKLNVDDCIIYLGTQYRVFVAKNYSDYSYLEYHLVQDYTSSGPTNV